MIKNATPNLSELKLEGFRVATTGTTGLVGRYLEALLDELDADHVVLAGDISEEDTFNSNFDVLIHLASPQPYDFKRNPKTANDINIQGIKGAIDACERKNAKLIFVSSSGVYQLPSEKSLCENAKIYPLNDYAKSKLECEHYCIDGGNRISGGVTIARVFNAYGYGQSTNFLFGYMVDQALRNREIVIRTPRAERDFIHAADVATALVKLIGCSASGQIYNVGSGQAYNIKLVSEKIQERFGSSCSIRYEEEIDPAGCVVSDIRKIRREVGWSPSIGLDFGLDEMIRGVPEKITGKVTPQVYRALTSVRHRPY